jgi:pterin-4a-carbinolamine dehydratase
MKNLFYHALKLSSTEIWKIKINMGYTQYFLFGDYNEASDFMKAIIEDYNMNK